MRRGRPRKICSHSFGPAKSGALWVNSRRIRSKSKLN